MSRLESRQMRSSLHAYPAASALGSVAAAAVLALALGSCGDALVEHGYRGEPLFTFVGQIRSFGEIQVGDWPIRASLFWSRTGRSDEAMDALIEQRSVTVGVTFPSAFTVNVFEPPPPELGADALSPYAVGLVLAYQDVDGNDAYTPGQDPEELLGGATESAVLWVPQELAADESPTGRDLAAGFSIVHLPLPCGAFEPASGDAEDDCGVALGSACQSDADCGDAGVCLSAPDWSTFRNGYCVLPETVGGCAPLHGSLIGLFGLDSFGFEIGSWYWFRVCTDDAECRLSESYGCDYVLSACWPRDPVWLDITRDFSVWPLCVEIITEESGSSLRQLETRN
ncbi:MAG: hypothetical protein HYV63_03820 [Candidatus Schekmanbacteria bacterium]|nr:hypothetical protein [Candidatus Schekmanbacteria bacterium]